MFPSPPSSPLPGESGLLIRGADSRAQVYTAEGRKVNIASPSNLSPCHRSSPPVYAYVHARICTALRGKFPRGAGGGGGGGRGLPRRCVPRLSRRVIILSAHSRVPMNRLSFIISPKVTHVRARARARHLSRNRYIRGLSCFRILS